ncbi:cathepsin L-like proteinase isoform X2 [Chironomus tepperi]
MGTITTSSVNITCSVSSIDWRTKGAVTPVKDQGNCGSCFAFAAVAAIESQILINYKKNISLSEQYAMECIYDFWKIASDSCYGGLPNYVYYLSYINQGLPTSSSVPYLGYDPGNCYPNVTLVKEAAITSYRTLSGYSESAIACMLATNGPMSVAIFVNESLIQYSSGIYNDVVSCGTNISPNHAVLLVGFGVDPITNLSYFILKNSWGTDWGEGGYFRMRKGVNLCNINSLPQQPYF